MYYDEIVVSDAILRRVNLEMMQGKCLQIFNYFLVFCSFELFWGKLVITKYYCKIYWSFLVVKVGSIERFLFDGSFVLF